MMVNKALLLAALVALALSGGCADAEDHTAAHDAEHDGEPAALTTYGGYLEASASPGQGRSDNQNGIFITVYGDGDVYFTLGVSPKVAAASVTFQKPTVRLVCDTGRYKLTPSKTFPDIVINRGGVAFYYSDSIKCEVGKLLSVTGSASYL